MCVVPTVKAVYADLAVRAHGVVLTVVALARHEVALVRVTVTLARHAGSTQQQTAHASVAGSALLA